MSQPPERRKKKLIKPGLQMRLVLVFLAGSIAAVLVQAIALNQSVMWLAKELPSDGSALLRAWPGILTLNVLLALGISVPITVGIGVLASFRIAGPIARFEGFLQRTVDGQQVKPCQLREGDELHDFCELLNQVTEEARLGRSTVAAEEEPPDTTKLAA